MFLDEVGELPLSLQVKPLRVMEDQTIRRVGGNGISKIDVRFIAATNRDLAARVRDGLFREDLFYRIGGATVSIPPLRERRVEIEPLTRGPDGGNPTPI